MGAGRRRPSPRRRKAEAPAARELLRERGLLPRAGRRARGPAASPRRTQTAEPDPERTRTRRRRPRVPGPHRGADPGNDGEAPPDPLQEAQRRAALKAMREREARVAQFFDFAPPAPGSQRPS